MIKPGSGYIPSPQTEFFWKIMGRSVTVRNLETSNIVLRYEHFLSYRNFMKKSRFLYLQNLI